LVSAVTASVIAITDASAISSGPCVLIMKPKTLTLLILTAIVIASVACGPSAPPVPAPTIQELKELALCEDALERRLEYDKMLKDLVVAGRDSSERIRQLSFSEVLDAERDIDEYCKDEPPTPVPTPTPNA